MEVEPARERRENEQEEEVRTVKKRRRSEIWKEFIVSREHYQCRHCETKLKAGNSTTTMRHHLKTHGWKPVTSGPERAPFDPLVAHQLLARLFATACLPLQLVEHENFKKFIAYLHAEYQLPSRWILRNDILPKLRDTVADRIRDKLKTIKMVSLTTDIWTSLATKGYLALTCHGIDKHFELSTFLLEILPIKESEKAVVLAPMIREALDKWDIPLGRVLCGTTDGASNMRSVIQGQLGVNWLHCIAHILNLCVRDALKHQRVKPMLKRAMTISNFFRGSPKAARALEENQQLLRINPLKLTIDNETRWNSALKMF